MELGPDPSSSRGRARSVWEVAKGSDLLASSLMQAFPTSRYRFETFQIYYATKIVAPQLAPQIAFCSHRSQFTTSPFSLNYQGDKLARPRGLEPLLPP